MLRPESEEQLSEIVRGAKHPLSIRGGATRHVPGAGDALTTAGLTGITLYEPGALTLVARAGTPMAEVEAALAAEGQRLPFEPMDHRALLGTEGTPTIGGAVAMNVSGPRRVQAGACRDSLIGVRFVDGEGTIIKNGGRVMKNVTGYDLVKVMAGAQGTLGILSEVSFKVLPSAAAEATLLVRGVDGLAALDAMTRGLRSPFDVSGAAAVPGEGAYLRLEGLAGSVAYRTRELTDLVRELGPVEVLENDASRTLWARLRDVTDFAQDSAAVWRVSMRPSRMVSGLLAALTQVVPLDYRLDWGGGLAWLRLTDQAAQAAAGTLEASGSGADAGIVAFHQALQSHVAEAGGHATLLHAPSTVAGQVAVRQPEAAGLAVLASGIRTRFDPRGLFQPTGA